jgi:TonB family protein
VPAAAMEARRLSGSNKVLPSADVRRAMLAAGDRRTMAVMKLCITRGGAVGTLELVQASEYLAFDEQVRNAIQSWSFRPFTINGAAVPVCAVFSFICTLD